MATHPLRLTLDDTYQTALLKLAEGNPGAIKALIEITQSVATVDPDNVLAETWPLAALDSYGIYGSDIYVLHSDLCYHNPVYTLAVLRAAQLGILPVANLRDACGRQDYTGRDFIKPTELLVQVKERLPRFDRPPGELEAVAQPSQSESPVQPTEPTEPELPHQPEASVQPTEPASPEGEGEATPSRAPEPIPPTPAPALEEQPAPSPALPSEEPTVA